MLSDKLTFEYRYRTVYFYEHHFLEFYNSLSNDAQLKLEYVLNLIQTLDWVPSKFFKHISGKQGLYEIRVEVESLNIRVFAIFDTNDSVILLNGFIKKSKKTPITVIDRAMKLKRNYYAEKKA